MNMSFALLRIPHQTIRSDEQFFHYAILPLPPHHSSVNVIVPVKVLFFPQIVYVLLIPIFIVSAFLIIVILLYYNYVIKCFVLQ